MSASLPEAHRARTTTSIITTMLIFSHQALLFVQAPMLWTNKRAWWEKMSIVVMMLVVVLALCASGKAADIRSTIERLNLEYTRVYNAGQLDKILDFFAEDAMTLSPDQEPVRGREALRRYYEAAFKREPHPDLVVTSIRSEQSGDLLYESGRWTQSLPMPDGKSQQFTAD